MASEQPPIARVSVLGPVLTTVDGIDVDLGGRKPRLLLASLLVAGRELSTDQLVDAVWGEQPPRSARNAVHVYVSHLRRALAEAPVVVTTPAGGYRFAIELVTYDVAEFESEVAAAGPLIADDPAAARDVLTSALERWRGDAFGDLAGDTAIAAEAARLEDLRLRALDLRLETDIALGRHEEIVAELEQLTEQYPYREGFRAKQMLALYRAGRQVEAVRAYVLTRRLLRDELGIDPSTELQQRYLQILDHAAALGAPAEATPPLALQRTARARLRSHNLGPEANDFIERAEVGRVVRLLAPHRVTTVVGPGGIGKSRVAVAAGRCVVVDRAVPAIDPTPDQHRTGRDGVWFADLAPLAPGSEDVAGVVAAAIGLGHQAGSSPAAALSSYLGGRAVLVILDNCEHVLPAVRRLVSEVLDVATDTAFLATSRVSLGLAAERTFTLEPMTSADARRLFEARIAEAGLGQFPVEEVEELCSALDHYPLAIELAAGRCRTLAPRELTALLGRHPRLLTSYVHNGGRHASLAGAMEWSLAELDAATRATLHAAAVFAHDFDLPAAQAVLGRHGGGDEASLVDRLDALVASHLLTRDHRRRRFRLLEPIRQVLIALDPPSPADERRYAEHYGALVATIGAGFYGPEEPICWDRLDDELANVRAALRWVVANRDLELLESMMKWMPYLVAISAFTEPGEWADYALNSLDLAPWEVPHTALTAASAFAQSERVEACDDLLDVLEEHLVDPALLTQLYVVRIQRTPADGLRWADRLVDFAAQAGDPIGGLLGRMRRFDHDSVAIADRLGSPTLRSTSRSFVYAAMDGATRAASRELIEEALAHALASNNSHAIAQMQIFLGAIVGRAGELERAAELLSEAIERMVRLRSPQLVWHAVESTANFLAVVGQRPRTSATLWAAVDHSKNVPYARQFRDPALPVGVAAVLSPNIAAAARRDGQRLGMDGAAALARKACERLHDHAVRLDGLTRMPDSGDG